MRGTNDVQRKVRRRKAERFARGWFGFGGFVMSEHGACRGALWHIPPEIRFDAGAARFRDRREH